MGALDAPSDPEPSPLDEDQDEQAAPRTKRAPGSLATPVSDPEPDDEVDEWGYESFPASDPPQH